MNKVNKWIAYLGGVVGVYLLYITIKKSTNNEVMNFTGEKSSNELNFNDFIPQSYPLLQTRMVEAIINDLNKVIKEKGIDSAIFETKKIVNILQRNKPTITQEQMIYLYGDILTRLNKMK